MSEPVIKTYEQILGEIISTYTSKIGIDDLNTGSAVLSFFEAVAQSTYRTSGDSLSILTAFSVDRAKGQALKKLQRGERVPEQSAKVATGNVTISDTSFEKISTKLYAGGNPPNIGSTTIDISDGSLFPTSGQIYIGRGTVNIEGPISYNGVTLVGGYSQLQLTEQTTKYHNNSETVILAQGGVRAIPSGTVVRTKSGAGAAPISFTTTERATILDGETEIIAVPVAANDVGDSGNVARGVIAEFATTPFVGASVTNPSGFTTGRNPETEDEIRDRIKRSRSSKGLGTVSVVRDSVLNISPDDENTTITSSQIISDGEETSLYIDNNQGYEPKSTGVGLETIVDSALGGERSFQLETGGRQTSVEKAFLEATFDSPYDIAYLDRLSILVGGVLSEHEFSEGDFKTENYATAYEIVASINANPDIDFEARTSNDGTRVVISAKEEDDEYLQITTPTNGNDVSVILGLPSSEVQTLRLYKNGQPLSKNGRSATIQTESQSAWSSTITDGDNLIVSIDNTSPITYTFNNSDFIAQGTFNSVSKNNSLLSWVDVINAKVTGLTAAINGTSIVLSSNLGKNSRAAISIDESSDLVSKGMFAASSGLTSQGSEADLVFSRNTAQFRLNTPLVAGDELSSGTDQTEGTVSSNILSGGSVTLSTDADLWLLLDEQQAEIINHGILSDNVCHITKQGNNTLRFRAEQLDAFTNIQVGDYFVIWSDEVSAVNRIEGRVFSVGTDLYTNDYFEVRMATDEYNATAFQTPFIFQEGINFIRTNKVPQKISIPAATYDINVVANLINDQIVGGRCDAISDEVLEIVTNTKSTNGSSMVFTFNTAGKSLGFTAGSYNESIVTQFAFYEAGFKEGDFPLFKHSKFTSDAAGDPSSSYIEDIDSEVDLSGSEDNSNAIVSVLNPYLYNSNLIEDVQPPKKYTQINKVSGNSLEIAPSEFIKRLRVDDRYYLGSPLNFGHEDSMVAILDGDSSNNTFQIPLYRKALTNSTMPVNVNSFRAYDSDSGSGVEFSSFFGNDFSFDNYKVLMKAKNVIDPSSGAIEDSVLFRAADWGRAGEKIDVSYEYSASADSEINHTVTVGERVGIKLFLKSGAPVANTIDGTTEWNVTVTPNTPVAGVEEVTYTYSGTGTSPSLGAVQSDYYVSILEGSELSSQNIGSFRISSATSTSFTVRRASGSGLTESNIATLENGILQFFQDNDTTAQEIVDYVNDNISDHITAEVLHDGTTLGSGVITRSTAEDSNFTKTSVSLVDGINWLYKSTLTAAAPSGQFTFKKPLTLASFNTNTTGAYSFNDGEELRFIPTTISQVKQLISVLAVSGITTLSDVVLSSEGEKLQFSTNKIGSTGSIQITGGTANSSSTSFIGNTSEMEGSDYVQTNIVRSAGAGFLVDQWVKVYSQNYQRKNTGINAVTNVSIFPNTPSVGKSTIVLDNPTINDKFFGQPRSNISEIGRAFHVEKHGDLVCISHDGETGASPLFSKSVDFNDDASGNVSVVFNTDTGYTEYTIDSGTRNLNEVQVGDLFTIDGFLEASNNGSFEVIGVSSDNLTVSVKNPLGVDEASTAIVSVSISTSIQEGDLVEIGDQFDNLNQGTYRVIRAFGDSFYIENDTAVEERVVVASNYVDLEYDATTQFSIYREGDVRLRWDNVGTQPNFSSVSYGDKVILGTDFDANNQGEYLVSKVQEGSYLDFDITLPPASDISSGQYFTFYKAGDATQYYVWFNKDAVGGDPALVGATGIEAVITATDTDLQVAAVVDTAIDGIVGFSTTLVSNVVTATSDVFGSSTLPSNVDVGGDFEITVNEEGSFLFLQFKKANVVAETVTITDVLEVNSQMFKFTPYNSSIIGDNIVISGDVLGEDNVGTYGISEIKSSTTAVVDSILVQAEDVTLADDSGQVYVEESILYTGYKQIQNKAVSPSNTNRYLINFYSNNQFDKINQSAGSYMEAIGKLSFPTSIINGLDSYRYNTGAIAEANRVVYGDPRDNVTYSGVAAAGAEIFIKAPKVRRIQISINIRLKTGVPFSTISQKVRNNISSIINSSPIGESIAISDIISSVNKIIGVKAVSISSPSYSASSDVIVINTAEKPFILDENDDIIVSKVE